MSSRKVTTNLTTASVIMIGTIATIKDRNVGISATTPSIIGPRVPFRSKAIFVHLAEITAIVLIWVTSYINVIGVYDVG
jgi:hypothetical protein